MLVSFSAPSPHPPWKGGGCSLRVQQCNIFSIVAANIPGLTLIRWGWVMCLFLNQSLGRLESDKLVGRAYVTESLLRLEEWANPET